jgi:hypothetical protein
MEANSPLLGALLPSPRPDASLPSEANRRSEADSCMLRCVLQEQGRERERERERDQSEIVNHVEEGSSTQQQKCWQLRSEKQYTNAGMSVCRITTSNAT